LSDVVRRDRVTNCRPWEAPRVGKDSSSSGAAGAYEDGFARGHADGLEAARNTLTELTARLTDILAALRNPLDAADDKVIEQLTSLTIAIAKRLVRRELRTNRSEVVAVVRNALAVLPVELRDVRLHLHPDDAKLISETLVPAQAEAAWCIVEDPVITRGGCRISSPTSQVDATMQTRLDRVINTMLGDDRGEDAEL